MNKRLFIFTAIVFLFADIFYSFLQHFHMPLDGDIAETVVPWAWIWELFKDPFGIRVISGVEGHPNPNRFFSHFTMFHYLRKAPIFLQHFTDPINSIYLSCALFKTIVQFLFITLLSCISSINSGKFTFKEFLIAALIITPLFQTAGYNRFMGIIDQSITYTFFYAFPILLLAIFFSIIYRVETNKKNYSLIEKIVLIILLIILPFSGPLIPGCY